MKNLLKIIFLLYFSSTISCKQNEKSKSVIKTNTQNNIGIDSIESKNINEFLQVALTCSGEEFSASKCFNKKTSLKFENGLTSFTINNKEYKYDDKELSGDLGYKIHLFENKDDKVILFDFFTENGHLFYTYYYNQRNLFLLEKKEFLVNEESNPIKY